jgi:CMP-N,N'-diacetyllegionaminic acid synthase
MKNLGKVVLHIPAREGSKRVPRKNIRLMAGSPMISYVIKAALMSGVTDNIYVNTDSEEIIDYVNREYSQLNIYKRNFFLASDTASSDQFNMDIINTLNPDTLIMINPVCPLIESTDIANAVLEYQNSDCDTLITCNETQMQTFCDGLPVNIRVNEQLCPSQDNKKVKILNWAITIWDARKFKKRFDELGYSVMGDVRLLHPINHLRSFKVSEEMDFQACQALIISNKR